MRTRILTKLSAAIEAITGVALIAAPELVARLAGCGLLALGLACWPGNEAANLQATRALFVYNLLAGLYLGYLRVGGGFVSYLLWPACAVHVVLGFMLARPAFARVLS